MSTPVELTTSLLHAALALAAPLLMAALGEIFAERSGVINIGLEGSMLVGAFAGMVVCSRTGSPWLGAAAGMIGGAAVALILAVFAITLAADQVVVGTAINLLALGLTGVFYRAIFGVTGSALTVATFQPLHLRVLDDLPFVGPVLFGHNVMVYLALALVPVSSLVLFRTRLGLHLRAVGESPAAADSLGVDVYRTRYACVLLSGLLAGLGGAYLSLGFANSFVENMTAGRGFIALAIVIFGRWNPYGALCGALLFGAATALQFQIQAFGWHIPYQFALMFPYVLTLVTLALWAGGARPPAALARPYEKP